MSSHTDRKQKHPELAAEKHTNYARRVHPCAQLESKSLTCLIDEQYNGRKFDDARQVCVKYADAYNQCMKVWGKNPKLDR
jgi:hypothetical protein